MRWYPRGRSICDLWSFLFFFSSRRRHTRCSRDWSSDVCSSDLSQEGGPANQTGGFGQGQEALWGMQRVLRQQVNRIRVSFHERYGNSALDARPYSLTETNPAKIPTWRERFGVNVGGPLLIPHVYDGREKTFFFINYNLARKIGRASC